MFRFSSVLLACALMWGAGQSQAYTTQPLLNRNGAGEGATCRECHTHRPERTEQGRLAIAGLPLRYVPGQSYQLSVRLFYPGLKRGGFQLSARQNDGTQAGTLKPTDDRAEVLGDASSGVQYAFHSEAGLAVSTETETAWTILWIAPANAQGAVTFNAAANAANADESALGDVILLFTATVEPV